MNGPQPHGPGSLAEEAFAEYLLQRDREGSVDFDRFCGDRPEFADELRVLYDDWQIVEQAFEQDPQLGSLTQSLLLENKNSDRPAAAEAKARFSEYLIRNRRGDSVSIDEVCRENPQLETDLRQLHEHWLKVEGLFEQLAKPTSIDTTMFVRHAREVISESDLGHSQTVKLIERLLAHRRGTRNYDHCGEVGRGGMGAILKVWDPNLRRNLAMKVIHKDLQRDVSKSPNSVDRSLARFLEEAQVTSQLDHPGIVPVHELGIDENGHPYFTMQLVRGRNLSAIFKDVWAEKGGWNRTRALGVLQRVCEAMAYAHSKQVVHRDLKPANIMVGRFGETYVMDWGLARVQGSGDDDQRMKERLDSLNSSPSLVATDRKEGSVGPEAEALMTGYGEAVGTPPYMAPEQADGRLYDIGPATDVYAIGAMLYNLLSQHTPFVDPDEPMPEAMVVLKRVRTGPPKALQEIAPATPAELVAICEKAMARTIASRYPNTRELADDLRAFLENRVVKAYEVGPVAEFKKWVVRNRGVASVAGATLFLSLGGTTGAAALFKKEEVAAKTDAQEQRNVAEEKRREAEAAQQELNRVEGQLTEKQGLLREAKENIAQAQQEYEAETARLEELRKGEQEQKERAEDEKEQVLRLSSAVQVGELVERADDLWPATPDRAKDYEAWLSDAESVAKLRPQLEERLTELRASGSPLSPAALAAERDATRKELLGELQLEREMAVLRLEKESVSGNQELLRQELAELDAEIERREEIIANLQPVVFTIEGSDEPDSELQWQHDSLVSLLETLNRLSGDGDLAADIRSRLELARTVEQRSITAYQAQWDEARKSIANVDECPAYVGLDLAPQVGLVPVGRNEATGLWEFVDITTGKLPPDGVGSFAADTGIVYVLIPGGSFEMGAEPARSGDPRRTNGEPNIDNLAGDEEGPITQVNGLAPFFMSKYELSQAQWSRITGDNPSQYYVGRTVVGELMTNLNPVESMTWEEAQRALQRCGALLPTEAQWEYACRAGTFKPWWGGTGRRAISGKVNVADKSTIAPGMPNWKADRDLDDGFKFHAPVNALEPNAWGLFQITGNVAEWCRDGYASYDVAPPAGPEGERPVPANAKRVARGGAYLSSDREVRSTARALHPAGDSQPYLGVRPVRRIR